jgi:hypothetical protein
MRLASFEQNGKTGFGVVTDAGIIDLGRALGGKYADLKALLAADALTEAQAAIAGRKPDPTGVNATTKRRLP